MKKILLGLVALSAVAFGANDNNYNNQNSRTQFKIDGMYLNFSLGLDRDGHYVSDGDDYKHNISEKTDDFGGEFAVEGYMPLNDVFDLGLGIAFQSHAAINKYSTNHDDYNDGKREDEYYNSVPVYLTGKFYLPLGTTVKPYLKADFGYSFNTEMGEDIDNGLYYGAGIGLDYNNFNTDFMYKKNCGEAELRNGDTAAADYQRFVLSVGYKLGL